MPLHRATVFVSLDVSSPWFSMAKSHDRKRLCVNSALESRDPLPPVQPSASWISVLEFRTPENKPKITATGHRQSIQSSREIDSNVKPRTNLRDSDLTSLAWSSGTCMFNQPHPTLPQVIWTSPFEEPPCVERTSVAQPSVCKSLIPCCA